MIRRGVVETLTLAPRDELIAPAVDQQHGRVGLCDGAKGIGVIRIEAGELAGVVDAIADVVVAEEESTGAKDESGAVVGDLLERGERLDGDDGATRGSIAAHWIAIAPP